MHYNDFFIGIKNNTLSGAYLLHGEEEFIKDSALKKLLLTVDETAYDLNVSFFDELNASALISSAESLPFFAEKRIIVCRQLPSGGDAETLLSYIPKLPETTLLIFFIRKKADEKLSFVKYFKQQNRMVTFDALSETDAVRFVVSTSKKLEALITPVAANRMVALCGTDASYLNNELTKAADYVGKGNEITLESISKSVTPNIEYRIFDMLDYFFNNKMADGLRALNMLLSNGDTPIGIAAFIASQLKRMLSARALIDKGLNKDKVVSLLGGSPYAAKKSHDAAKHYSYERISEALIDFSDISHLKITGAMNDKDALIFFIVKNFTSKKA
ncbi:MAG: DNA polymerase III subunit delta [Clostridia bacterium]|nr:DNA polymerase III subunit delta [Clostridia bacterium]